MIALIASTMNAKKDIEMEALALWVKSSLPNLDIQTSLREAATEEADIKRYASICIK